MYPDDDNQIKRAGSCDLGMPASLIAPPKSELEITAENLGITPAKLKAAREYARKLHLNDRRMKMSTVRRKVMEKFNIKLV